MSAPQQVQPKKKIRTWQIVVAAVVGLAIIGGIATLLNPERDRPGAATPAPTSNMQSEDTSEPVPEETGLAEAVWSNVTANYPGGIAATSPLYAVTDTEDVSATAIRVYVQENLNDAQREEVARNVYNLGATDIPALSIVVVRDASGIDSNHYR